MKYFIDTEFIECPNSIELISIGIKCEDGRTYYAVSSEYDPNKADKWVLKHVITLIYHEMVDYNLREVWTLKNFHEYNGKTIKEIRAEILDFVKYPDYSQGEPEFWGYCCAYDWVLFCRIFNGMINLPIGFPGYCRDLAQLMDELDIDKLPKNKNRHNALSDAEWHEKIYQHIQLTPDVFGDNKLTRRS